MSRFTSSFITLVGKLVGSGSAIATTESSRCRLLELPCELRFRIFEHVYDQGDYRMEVLVDSHAVYADFITDGCHLILPHFTALLVTCRQIRREALPVLFEATALELDICAAAVRKPDANVGPLDRCIIFKHVKKINELSVLKARQDIAVIASRVMDVIDALPSHRTIIVRRIGLSLGELDKGDADPVIRALLALKCEPDVTFGLVRPSRLWNSACVSPELAREFVKKFSNAASLCEAHDGVQGSKKI
ncbi:hypothetical protein LTR17_005755 [Elasticomyces elasticus]|nr:hypothetical protein LTR17_005755 [Elasticomyces elasticus]